MPAAILENARKRTRKPRTQPPATRVAISRNLTIYEAHTLKDELQDGIAGNTAVELDLSQVAEIDSAGVQLLLLAHRECRRAGRTLRIALASAAVQELLVFYNLAAMFDCPMPPPPAPAAQH